MGFLIKAISLQVVSFVLLFILMGSSMDAFTQTLNGFDLSNASIPVNEIKQGGPPKDGIPSIDNPRFINSNNSNLPDNARVLGVNLKGKAKAYPIGIMNYHEIVNDRFGGIPVVITYCPLCGSGVAYEGMIDKKEMTFGVSGLLYNSDVLLFDRQTESLWSQMMSEAVAGPMKGEKLIIISTANTTWKEWKDRFNDTKLLSEETGHTRDYSRTPYTGYEESQRLYFPVAHQNYDYHQKEFIIGLEYNKIFKAYPFPELSKSTLPVQDSINGLEVLIYYDKKNKTARITDAQGNDLPAIVSFWFAWYAFHPDTEVFVGGK